MVNYAPMVPLYVDAMGRIHQSTNGYPGLAAESPTLYPLSAFPNHDSNATSSLPIPISQSFGRLQTLYDSSLLSMSAPARMPVYSEYLTPMSMPMPQQHPGLFRVNSAAPATISLEPASGPQRSVSARPTLQTARKRRDSSVEKDKEPEATKTKPTGVAFPAYVDRVEIPDDWKQIYESGQDLPAALARPPYDYAGLIGRVLLEDTDKPKRMTVAELFYALINKYPFYMAHPRLLYNGLRHNLTGCEALIKADRQWGDQASSRYWTIKPGCESCFGTGYYVRDAASRGAARARKSAAQAEAQSAETAVNFSGSGSALKPRVIPYSAKSTRPRPPVKKATSSPELDFANALELAGMKRKALANKINSDSRKSGTGHDINVDVEFENIGKTSRERIGKKGAMNAKLEEQPFRITLPNRTRVFPSVGVLAPTPMPIQYSNIASYPSGSIPLGQAVTNDLAINEPSRLSSLSALAISAPTARTMHVTESSASESDLTSPEGSSLASALDYTLVQRRSQEELQAVMQQQTQ